MCLMTHYTPDFRSAVLGFMSGLKAVETELSLLQLLHLCVWVCLCQRRAVFRRVDTLADSHHSVNCCIGGLFATRSVYVVMRGFSGVTSGWFSDNGDVDEMAATFAVVWFWPPLAVRRPARNLIASSRSEKFFYGSPRRHAFLSFFQKCSPR